jgi:uncharacterized protein DUF1441
MKDTYSISQLTALTKLDRATVTKRLEGVAFAEGTKGAHLYTLSDALPALIKGESKAMEDAKLRKMQAEAELKQHELAIERGEYLSVKDVESQYVKECQWLYNRLIAQLPQELATQLYKAESAAQIAEVLKHDLGRILNEWRET